MTQKLSKACALHSTLIRSIKYDYKQRAIAQKLRKQELLFMCIALPLMRSIHQQNFIKKASIVLETCSGQNSSMTINKGQ